MTWLSILLFMVMHIPDFVEIVRVIIRLIHGLPMDEQMKAKLAFETAIKSGDLEKVKEVATHWKAHCEGVACPTPLQ